MRPFNIVLADPFLENVSGHHYSYLKSIQDELTLRKLNSVIIGNIKSGENFLSSEIISHFKANQPYKKKEKARLLHKIFKKFYLKKKNHLNILEEKFEHDFINDLLSLKKYCLTGQSNIIFFDSFKPEHLIVLVKCLAEKLLPTDDIKYVVMLHFTSDLNGRDQNQYRKIYQDSFDKIQKYDLGKILCLITDTDLLAQEFNSFADIIVPVFPIPHIKPRTRALEEKDKSNIQISFLGPARREKGFQHTVEVAQFLKQKKFLDKKFQLIVQSNTLGKMGYRHNKIIKKLKIYGASLIERPLNNIEYNDIVSNTSIMPLPYSTSPYHRQSSGVFAEALSYGAVCVVPNGTWMASELKKLSLGLIYDPLERGSFLKNLDYAIENFEGLSKQYKEASFEWAGFHNPKTFVDSLFSLVS